MLARAPQLPPPSPPQRPPPPPPPPPPPRARAGWIATHAPIKPRALAVAPVLSPSLCAARAEALDRMRARAAAASDDVIDVDESDIVDAIALAPQARTSPPPRAFARSAPPPSYSSLVFPVAAATSLPPAPLDYRAHRASWRSDPGLDVDVHFDDADLSTALVPRKRRRSAIPWLALAAAVAIGVGLWRDPSARVHARAELRDIAGWNRVATAVAHAHAHAPGPSRADATRLALPAPVTVARFQPSSVNVVWSDAPAALRADAAADTPAPRPARAERPAKPRAKKGR